MNKTGGSPQHSIRQGLYNKKTMKRLSVIGISIGGTKTAVTHAFFDGAFSQIEKKVFPTIPDHADQEMDRIFNAIDEFI